MKGSTIRRSVMVMLLAVITVLAMALMGCGSSNTASTSTSTVASTSAASAQKATQTITDMAGRTVTIPTNPTKVMGAANPDGIMIYSIDPSLLTGWTFDLSDDAKAYLTSDAAALSKITSVSKWEDPNKEELLSMNPDFIFVTVDLTNVDLSLYDDVTAQTGIPIVVGDAELSHLGDTYRFLAGIMGDDNAAQCNKCADFCDKVFSNVDSTMNKVTTKTNVFYSTGDDGTQTCGDSNWNGQFVTPAGGVNVCDTDQASGFATASMEQIIAWKPDVIISTAKGDLASIYGSDAWKDIPAVQNHQVYAAPQFPFSWVDKPTGVNRIIGVEWTNSVLYPDDATYDIQADVKEFYSTFYHYDLTDDQVTSLLNTVVDY